MSVVHLTHGERTACGRPRGSGTRSDDPELTTCQRCRQTRAWDEAMSALTVRVEAKRGFALTAEQSIDQQRNFTIREVLDYMREGDPEAALNRLMVGFQRQVRLAGLERYLREGETQ